MGTILQFTRVTPAPKPGTDQPVGGGVASPLYPRGKMIHGYHDHMIRKHRSPHTIRLRLFYLTKFEQWLGQDLTEATHEDFEAYIHANPAWSENTQASATASLKSLYAWAHREGILAENPTRDLPSIDVHRRRPRIASEEAIVRAIQCDSLTDRAMVLLGAECGLRVTEIATLHRDNRDGSWLRIIGKGNNLRTVHLSPELEHLLGVIEATTMRCGWYFPGQDVRHPIHPSTAWRHITAVLNSNPHSLRRRAGTIIYRNSGHDIRLAQVFLGHKNASTTEQYLDVQDDDLMKAGDLTRIAA